MNRTAVFITVLEVVLAVSICLNVYLYVQNQQSDPSANEAAVFNGEFGDVPILCYHIDYGCPISMHQALTIALKDGGWNKTSLEGQTLTANLNYIKFNADQYGSCQILEEVTQPVDNYSAVQDGNSTYRYVWNIVVSANMPWSITPRNGLYYIDATTGEIITSQMHILV